MTAKKTNEPREPSMVTDIAAQVLATRANKFEVEYEDGEGLRI